jgi:glycosyltransferase involved in cell wall biosynthesis
VRISVVTPSFGLKRYLRETIVSVLGNLRPQDEYFIIDGGSQDGSLEVIRDYEERLTGWVSEPDGGYADALRKGFERASGDLLCWINASDLLLPGALDAARDALMLTGADLIFGDDFHIDEDSRVLGFSRGYVADLRSAMLYAGWTPLQDACFWRRTLYERVGGIDSSLKYAADYDLFLRMALAGRAAYIPKAFSAFRRHAGQKSISGSRAYRDERRAAQARTLKGVRQSAPIMLATGLLQGISVRWRVHISQKRWRRHDLVGRPVQTLACGSYWPRAEGGT